MFNVEASIAAVVDTGVVSVLPVTSKPVPVLPVTVEVVWELPFVSVLPSVAFDASVLTVSPSLLVASLADADSVVISSSPFSSGVESVPLISVDDWPMKWRAYSEK